MESLENLYVQLNKLQKIYYVSHIHVSVPVHEVTVLLDQIIQFKMNAFMTWEGGHRMYEVGWMNPLSGYQWQWKATLKNESFN